MPVRSPQYSNHNRERIVLSSVLGQPLIHGLSSKKPVFAFFKLLSDVQNREQNFTDGRAEHGGRNCKDKRDTET
jgi:hypothetical protein